MTAPERWLPVVDYEGLYEVSDLGRVRSLRQSPPLVLAQARHTTNPGYFTVEMRDRQGKRRQRLVNVAVIRAFRGPAPTPAHRCAHDDGNSENNTLPNLLWKTMKENMADRERHGRTARGEKNGSAKMTEAQAIQVKSLLADPSNKRIAEAVGVARKSVESIRNGRSWRHLP